MAAVAVRALVVRGAGRLVAAQTASTALAEPTLQVHGARARTSVIRYAAALIADHVIGAIVVLLARDVGLLAGAKDQEEADSRQARGEQSHKGMLTPASGVSKGV